MDEGAAYHADDPSPDNLTMPSTSSEIDEKIENNESTEQQQEETGDTEEQEECRVCRGPAEEGRALYAPCKCSGSIGLTHQDCLTSWLAVTRGDGRCELCSTHFQFAPKYAEGAPDQLSPHEVLLGLSRRALARWLPFAIRALIAASLWLCVLPLATAYLYQGWMHRPSSIVTRWKWELLAGDAVSGAVVAAIIILSFLSLMSFADFLRFHWQQRGGGGGERRRQQQQRGRQGVGNNRVQPGAWNEHGGEEDGGIDDGFLDHDDNRNQGQLQPDVQANEADREGGWRAGHPRRHQRLREHHNRDRHHRGDRHWMDLANHEQRQQDERLAGEPVAEGQNEAVLGDAEVHGRRLGWRIQGGAEFRMGHDHYGEEGQDANRDGGDAVVGVARDEQPLHQRGEVLGGGVDNAGHFAADDALRGFPPRRQMPRGDAGPFARGVADDDADLEEMMRAQEGEERRIREDQNRNVPGNARNQQPMPRDGNNDRFPEPLDPLFDQDEGMDMEIHVALDELLGLRGPFGALIRNLLWLLAFNTTYLGLFVFIPHTIGESVYSTARNSTAFSSLHNSFPHINSTLIGGEDSLEGIVTSLNGESQRLNTIFKLPDLATVSLGYFSMAFMVFLLHMGFCLWRRFSKKSNELNRSITESAARDMHDDRQAVAPMLRNVPPGENIPFQHQAALGGIANGREVPGDFPDDDGEEEDFDEAFGVEQPQLPPVNVRAAVGQKAAIVLECSAAIVKVGVLLFLKMLLLPLLLGIWLDASTLSLFGRTIHDRILYTGRDLFGSILLHWVAGITFMLLVTVSVLQLREVVHPDLLAKIIRPQEPQPDLLGNLLQESGTTHAKRMVLSLGIYAALLMVHVWFPSRILVWLGVGKYVPFFRPKIWHVVLPQLQVPIELLVFHLSMLAFLEKYKNHIGEMQHHWLRFMCDKMKMTDHLLPRRVEKFVLVGFRPLHASTGGDEHDDAQEGVSGNRNTKKDAEENVASGFSAEEETDGGASISQVSSFPGAGEEDEREHIDKSNHSDKFWSNLLSMKDDDRDEYILSNIQKVSSPASPIYEVGITALNGERNLTLEQPVILVPLSRQGETASGGRGASSVDPAGARADNNYLVVPSSLGAYRLRLGKGTTIAFDSQDGNADYAVVQFWREVAGKPIARPPEGWDDLGVGGAEVQGRWAWSNEKKSAIEESVAHRTCFFDRPGTSAKSKLSSAWVILKMLLLLILSWFVILVFVCVAVSAPLLMGRFVFYLLRFPDQRYHDPMAFAVGGTFLFPIISRVWGALTARVDDPDTISFLGTVWKWAASFRLPPSRRKVIVMTETFLLWFVVSPFLLGSHYDLIFIKSRSWWAGSEFLVDWSSLATDWGTGTLLLNAWAFFCFVGIFTRDFWSGIGVAAGLAPAANDEDEGEMDDAEGEVNIEGHRGGDPIVENREDQESAELERKQKPRWQGDNGRVANFARVCADIFFYWEWDKVDRITLVADCALPVVQQISIAVFTPLAAFVVWLLLYQVVTRGRDAAGVVLPIVGFVEKGFYRMALFRMFAVTVVSIQLAVAFRSPLQRWFQAAHKAARDDRYLVGEILLNYQSPNHGRGSSRYSTLR